MATKEESIIYNHFSTILKLSLNEKQDSYYKALRDRVEIIQISQVSELPEQIRPLINDLINEVKPKVKQCYRNAQLFALKASAEKSLDVKYVEGYMTAIGLPIDHAFNAVVFNGRTYYFDITTLAKGFPKTDLQREYSYVAVYDKSVVFNKLLKLHMHTRWIDEELSNQLFK